MSVLGTHQQDSPTESVVNVDSIVICEIANRKAINDIKKVYLYKYLLHYT